MYIDYIYEVKNISANYHQPHHQQNTLKCFSDFIAWENIGIHTEMGHYLPYEMYSK